MTAAGKFLCSYVLALLLFAGASGAFAGTMTSGTTTVQIADNSCAAVIQASNLARMAAGSTSRVIACSHDPVIVGALLMTVASNTLVSGASAVPKWGSDVTQIDAPIARYSLPTLSAAFDVLLAQGGNVVEAFDYVKASAVFAFFFSFIVGVWVFSKNIGLILNAVRRW